MHEYLVLLGCDADPLGVQLPTFKSIVVTSIVSVDKTKHMVVSRDQNAGRIQSVWIDNSIFERVEEFKYLGTTLTNQNSIAEEIKSRRSSGNACYNSVQNLLSSRLLSKNLKNKINRTIILSVVYVGVKLGRRYCGRKGS